MLEVLHKHGRRMRGDDTKVSSTMQGHPALSSVQGLLSHPITFIIVGCACISQQYRCLTLRRTVKNSVLNMLCLGSKTICASCHMDDCVVARPCRWDLR